MILVYTFKIYAYYTKLGGGLILVISRPYLMKWSNLISIFQMGWFNHHLENSLHLFTSFPLKRSQHFTILGGHGSSLKLRRDGASCVQSHRGSSALEQFRGRSSFGGATTDTPWNWGGRSGENSAWEKKKKLSIFFQGWFVLCWAFNGFPENPFGRSELWIWDVVVESLRFCFFETLKMRHLILFWLVMLQVEFCRVVEGDLIGGEVISWMGGTISICIQRMLPKTDMALEMVYGNLGWED